MRSEVRSLLAQLDGVPWLIAGLLYGAGLRLAECLRLRVKDVDFSLRTITVRDGKGTKDRVTVLPEAMAAPLEAHLDKIRVIHELDLAKGLGRVYLPFALARKYPRAAADWGWRLFPAGGYVRDPASGKPVKHLHACRGPGSPRRQEPARPGVIYRVSSSGSGEPAYRPASSNQLE